MTTAPEPVPRRKPGQAGGLAALDEAVRWYRSMMAWDTRVAGTEVRLRLGRGVVAFLTYGPLTAKTRSRLQRAEVEAPLVVMGSPDRGVFIADANDRLWSQREMPPGVVFLGAPREVPLPPSRTPGYTIRWATRPESKRRWLPAAETIFGAIKSAVR